MKGRKHVRHKFLRADPMTGQERQSIARGRRRQLARIIAAKYRDESPEPSLLSRSLVSFPWDKLMTEADVLAAATDRILSAGER